MVERGHIGGRDNPFSRAHREMLVMPNTNSKRRTSLIKIEDDPTNQGMDYSMNTSRCFSISEESSVPKQSNRSVSQAP